MNSRLVLYIIGALVVKYRRCSLAEKNWYHSKITKLYVLYTRQRKVDNVNKKIWVRDIFTEEQRLLQGSSENLVEEMRLKDQNKFYNYLRMSPETFDCLLSAVEPIITRQKCVREPIEPKVRLQITLRYLASGDSMTSLSYSFRVGKQTVSTIISDTCEAIWQSLKDEVFIKPTVENWNEMAKEFNEKWNFKNCIGAIDGKHIVMQALPKSGSNYYNYKGSHSIVLLAICDANYKFTMVDIGAPGRLSDSGIFRESQMGKGFEQNIFNVPPPSEGNLPYVLVGDEAFPLSSYLMRPYPRRGDLDLSKKVFNYRLSRARRVVENAFGLLAAKWRIFRKPIIASENTVIKIVKASTCLHNFLLMQIRERENYSRQDGSNELNINNGIRDITRAGTNTYTRNAATLREIFTEYFNGVGAVEWQWQKALNSEF